MFNFFRKKKKSANAFDAALKRLLLFHEACMLFLDNLGFNDNEKATLAINLYFLGAVDCSSQRHTLSDKEFGQLALSFFKQVGENDQYVSILLMYFLRMDVLPEAQSCVIEGGQHFNKWLNGNSEIPMSTMTTIEAFCDDPGFPKSAGHLYVAIEGR